MNAIGADDGHAAETVGKEFAVGYYDALTAVVPGNEEALERFCDRNSKYLFLQHECRTEFQVRGAAEIAKFAVRMKYHECAVDMVSMDAIKILRPGGISPLYTVLTVCKLTRHGTDVPHVFVQSTVIRYVPRTLFTSENRFTIIGTVFKFTDSTAADNGLEPDFEMPSVEPDPGPLPSVPKQLSDQCDTAAVCPRLDDGDGVDAFAIAVKSERISRKSKTKRGKHKAETQDAAIDALAATVISDGNNKTKGKTAACADDSRITGTVSVAQPDGRRLLKPQTERPESAAALVDGVDSAGSGGPKKTETKRAANNAETATAVTSCSAENSNDHDARVNLELYVGGLSRVVQRDEIYSSFCRFDAIADVRIHHNKRKKKGAQHFSIVRFSDPVKMAAVVKLGTIVLNNGNTVTVRKSNPKKPDDGKSQKNN